MSSQALRSNYFAPINLYPAKVPIKERGKEKHLGAKKDSDSLKSTNSFYKNYSVQYSQQKNIYVIYHKEKSIG